VSALVSALAWFVLHLAYCVLVTMTCLSFPFGAANDVAAYPPWMQCAAFVVCAKALTMTAMELSEFRALLREHGWLRGWHIYFEKGDASTASALFSVTGIFKMLAWLANVNSLVGVCLVLSNVNVRVIRAMMVFLMLCEWLHTLMFLQAFQSTGRLVVTISKILAKDVTRFVFIYLIILCAFSSSLALLSMDEYDNEIEEHGDGENTNWIESMFIMFEISLGMGSFFGKDLTDPFDVALSQLLYVVFLLLSVVLLLNMLIAIMTETTEEVRAQATEQWLLQWASTVLLIERRVPKCLYKRTGNPGAKFGFTQKNMTEQFFITFTQTKTYNDRDALDLEHPAHEE